MARVMRLNHAQLRTASSALRRLTGLRVELEAPPPPPTPRRGKHAGIVHHLDTAIRAGLPPGRVLVQGASIRSSHLTARLTPDLTVCPAGHLESDDSFLHPQDVEFAAEIVTATATAAQIDATVAAHAAAGIRALLVIDPRVSQGAWTLRTDPVGAHYWVTRHGPFGDPIPLPPPLRLTVPTGRLRRYGPPTATGRHAST